jgi:hypothetical protein
MLGELWSQCQFQPHSSLVQQHTLTKYTLQQPLTNACVRAISRCKHMIACSTRFYSSKCQNTNKHHCNLPHKYLFIKPANPTYASKVRVHTYMLIIIDIEQHACANHHPASHQAISMQWSTITQNTTTNQHSIRLETCQLRRTFARHAGQTMITMTVSTPFISCILTHANQVRIATTINKCMCSRAHQI